MYLFKVMRHLFNYFCRCLIKERCSVFLFRSYYKQWLCRTLTIFPPPPLSTSLYIAWEGLSQLHQAHSLHVIPGQSTRRDKNLLFQKIVEMTLFIRYIYYWNLHFLNNVIINKTEVLLPSALWFYCLFYFERHLMNVIPETRRVD